jgi:hypothetical protein
MPAGPASGPGLPNLPFRSTQRRRSRATASGEPRSARPEISIKDQYKAARTIGQLEAAQHLHQIVNLASDGGPARFEGASMLVLPDHVTAKNFPHLAALTARAMKIEAFASTVPKL